jgi:phosphoglycerate dehydrogenase-like enzyme
MKPGAVLINIGRGGLVDDEALRRGLDRDQPAQAVLDVFTKEPLPADNWMWNHPKIRVTAHTSHFGHGTMGRGDTLFLDNLKRFLAGEPLLNEASKSEVGL